MKTIRMTIDEELLNLVDTAVQALGTNRSAFLREALRLALKRMQIVAMEKQQIAGYKRYPLQAAEFDVWQSEQVMDIANESSDI
jgi:metal-responsive CopG/Arc/MetJ family transcriptional regulator